jgi:hypothetical protein
VVRRTEGVLSHVVEPASGPVGWAIGALEHCVEQFSQSVASVLRHAAVLPGNGGRA